MLLHTRPCARGCPKRQRCEGTQHTFSFHRWVSSGPTADLRRTRRKRGRHEQKYATRPRLSWSSSSGLAARRCGAARSIWARWALRSSEDRQVWARWEKRGAAVWTIRAHWGPAPQGGRFGHTGGQRRRISTPSSFTRRCPMCRRRGHTRVSRSYQVREGVEVVGS